MRNNLQICLLLVIMLVTMAAFTTVALAADGPVKSP